MVLFSGQVPGITYCTCNTTVKTVLCSAEPQGESTGLLAVERQLSEFSFFLSERFLFKLNTGWKKKEKKAF